MKRNIMHWMIAAAALAVAAGSASAQSLKAEIPFAFHAGGVLMPPGAYSVTRSVSSASQSFVIYNPETRQSVILAHYVPSDAPAAWRADTQARLAFECSSDNCVLRTVWTAAGEPAYNFFGHKPSGDEPVHIAVVRMTSAKTE